MSRRRFRRLDALALGLSLVILLALFMPMGEHPAWQWLFNLAHVPVFALLAWLWAEDLLDRRWPLRRRLITIALAGLAISLATEGLQSWVPGRQADLADLARNAFGLLAGLVLHGYRPGLLAGRAGGRDQS
ncbi:MAG: hypothetical protein KatS3mg127_0648 [Silanimonas sp.]|nr:MAG: hypothetical protein KatS3mg127_0648 [Silanimonas sp.]